MNVNRSVTGVFCKIFSDGYSFTKKKTVEKVIKSGVENPGFVKRASYINFTMPITLLILNILRHH